MTTCLDLQRTGAQLTSAVGTTILDNIPMSRRDLRPVANVWSRWSISHINFFAAIYRAVPIVLPAAAITEGVQDLLSRSDEGFSSPRLKLWLGGLGAQRLYILSATKTCKFRFFFFFCGIYFSTMHAS
jgi:hypothetical protein